MRYLTLALSILLLPLFAEADDRYELVTTTTTGRQKTAEADHLNVFVSVNGSEPQFKLNNENINDFKKGAADRFPGFFMSTSPDAIKFIELDVQGGDAWLLEKIEFEVFSGGTSLGHVNFEPKQWMSGEHERGKSAQKRIRFSVDGRFSPTPKSASSSEGAPEFVPEPPTDGPPLPSPASASAATPSAVSKSTLEILADDGPLITDQVLSALDQPSIPEATISLWKEDLLDEAAQDTPTRQPAYQQGALLLDAWKAALRERYKLIEDTKFSGAVMDAPDMSSSKKTVLHAWDWLQYARERDAAAKHEKKLERTAEFFAFGPPRRWAERSAILRVNIERFYKAFRKSRREIPAQE